MSRPPTKRPCPNCSHVPLTEAEERLLAAMVTSPDPRMTARDLTPIVGLRDPTTVRTTMTSLIDRGLAVFIGPMFNPMGRAVNLYAVTAAGREWCLRVAGREGVAAE